MHDAPERGLLDELRGHQPFGSGGLCNAGQFIAGEADCHDGAGVRDRRELLERVPVPGIRVHQLALFVVQRLTKSVVVLGFHEVGGADRGALLALPALGAWDAGNYAERLVPARSGDGRR